MITLKPLAQKWLPKLTPQLWFVALAIGCWLITMILFPIAYWTVGHSVIPIGITIAAIAQSSAVIIILLNHLGWRPTLRIFVLIAILTWTAEAIGSKTGVPFGEYQYTDVIQPQLFGVPLLIPVAWFMLFPSAWAIAQMIVGTQRTTWQTRVAFIAVSAVALTAWDLFLDPQMVGWNFWVWKYPSGFFGIPWSNYAGWLLVSAIVTALVNPPPLATAPLFCIYACVWFLQSIGLAVFWGQPAPALFGSLAMAGMIVWAYIRNKGIAS